MLYKHEKYACLMSHVIRLETYVIHLKDQLSSWPQSCTQLDSWLLSLIDENLIEPAYFICNNKINL